MPDFMNDNIMELAMAKNKRDCARIIRGRASKEKSACRKMAMLYKAKQLETEALGLEVGEA